jgi:hypothetical protein
MSRKNNSKARRDERYWEALERQEQLVAADPRGYAPVEEFMRTKERAGR